MVKDERLERVATGVYRIRGATAPDHLQLRAAWLQLDPARPAWQRIADPADAVVSHASAATLYGVGDLPSDAHEFTLADRRQTRRPDVRLHRGAVSAHERAIVHGLPVTRPNRIIGDLLADHVDIGAVAQITREVLEQVYDYPARVASAIAPFAARFGFRSGDAKSFLDYLLRFAGTTDTTEWLDLASSNERLR